MSKSETLACESQMLSPFIYTRARPCRDYLKIILSVGFLYGNVIYLSSMSSTLYFASSNKGKIEETQKIIGYSIKIAEINIDEIQSLDLEKIIKDKAEKAFHILEKPLIVDDIGLYIEAWNGFPGPFIRFLNHEGSNSLLLKLMKNEANRSVIARGAIGYHDGRQVYSFIGEVKGSLAQKPRGKNGWGWDTLFIPEGSSKTYGEMSPDEKVLLNHRTLALKQFKKFLKTR